MTFQNEIEAEIWATAFNKCFGSVSLKAADCALMADEVVELYRERAPNSCAECGKPHHSGLCKDQ